MQKIDNANELISRLISIGNAVIYILIAFAFIYIIWSIVAYFIKGKQGDEGRKEAGMHILWGIIGLAVILSIWGLVNIVLNTFRTDNNAPRDKFPSADFINAGPEGGRSGTSQSSFDLPNNLPLYDAPSNFGGRNEAAI